jgi:hypothetical protein
MGTLRSVVPSLLVAAVFGRHPDALAWAEGRLEEAFGPVALASPSFLFNQTRYYEPTMGTGVQKRLSAFGLVAPDRLPDFKHQTNALEQELIASGRFAEARPVNIDPGLLSLGKFTLATTKDQQHRIYLRDGIFAEVTLRYEAGAWSPWPWTYADYRQPMVLAFLEEARRLYRNLLRADALGNSLSVQ